MFVHPELAQFADRLGLKRAEFRKRLGSLNNNNLTTTYERDVAMHIQGTRGEAGLYQFFGGKRAGAVWNAWSDDPRCAALPDIVYRGHYWDAKAIHRNGLALCIEPSGVKPAWRYVLVGIEHWPDVELLGWCPGEDVLTLTPEERSHGRLGYFIDQGDALLRPLGR
jgi:hypothetical protein